MKRLFMITTTGLFLTFIFQQANAQTEKGNWLLSGSGTFQHLHYQNGYNSTLIQFYPKGGFFVINHLAIGLMPAADMTILGKSQVNIGSYNSYTLSIGPFARYYYPLSSSVSLFAEGYFTYGHHFYKPKNNQNYNQYNWRIGPGVAFFLSPSVSLDVSAGYGQNHSVNKNAGVTYKSKTGITDVQLGFSIYLPGKKK